MTLRYQSRLESRYKQLQEQNKQIKQQVANRTLDAMHRKKDEFIGITVHDLKNPLNSVLGFSELLLNEQSITGEVRENVGSIHASSLEMLEQVEDLLKLTELESVTTGVDLEVVDASALIRRVAQGYEYQAVAKGIQIQLDLPAAAVNASAVENWFVSAVGNLISNAIKYSPRGGKIVISLSHRDGSVEITVQDHAEGIAPGEQARLFRKFERLSPRPTGGESSNGLGLYIFQQIVAKIDGRVSCKSAPGEGSEFTISQQAAI